MTKAVIPSPSKQLIVAFMRNTISTIIVGRKLLWYFKIVYALDNKPILPPQIHDPPDHVNWPIDTLPYFGDFMHDLDWNQKFMFMQQNINWNILCLDQLDDYFAIKVFFLDHFKAKLIRQFSSFHY